MRAMFTVEKIYGQILEVEATKGRGHLQGTLPSRHLQGTFKGRHDPVIVNH